MSQIFEKGTIKVVWIKDDTGVIYSKMFEDLKSAKEFAEGKDSLVFKLLWQKELTGICLGGNSFR